MIQSIVYVIQGYLKHLSAEYDQMLIKLLLNMVIIGEIDA